MVLPRLVKKIKKKMNERSTSIKQKKPFFFMQMKTLDVTLLLQTWFADEEDKNLVKEGQYVTLVQSGAQPIWRQESTHHIQVRMVQG
uniref:Pyruvate kinase isozyme G, chloroplastic n=1 Tax=Tanacetum cinerariifolium TaxID=118510 RepID=A0A699J5S0_TANCI|nr:pyruvate kinase isozyme G, chloroplastic [Tanacetum cinerariifolium]GFA68141.1 pyruvate kinase isozyme G, chloroplastic [Tanacetum cinerariifolium]